MSYGRWFLVRVVGTETDEQVSAACSLLERVLVDGHFLRDEGRVACLPYGATFAATAWTTEYVIISGSNTAWAEKVRATVAAAAGTALPGLAVEFDWMGDVDSIRALAALDDRDDRPIEVPALYPDIHSFRLAVHGPPPQQQVAEAFPVLSAVVRAHRLDDFVFVDVLGSGPAAATAYTPAPMIIKDVAEFGRSISAQLSSALSDRGLAATVRFDLIDHEGDIRFFRH
jgi:hypothetical protein